jgi:Na+/melibiose symporter-like transporter
VGIGFEANTTPTQRVIDGISSMITLGPAAAYLVAAAIFFFGYKLNEAHVLQMQQEINARKVAAATHFTK